RDAQVTVEPLKRRRFKATEVGGDQAVSVHARGPELKMQHRHLLAAGGSLDLHPIRNGLEMPITWLTPHTGRLAEEILNATERDPVRRRRAPVERDHFIEPVMPRLVPPREVRLKQN